MQEEEIERKTKNIKIKPSIHEEIGKLGTARDDYGDLIEKLYNYWKAHHKHGETL